MEMVDKFHPESSIVDRRILYEITGRNIKNEDFEEERDEEEDDDDDLPPR